MILHASIKTDIMYHYNKWFLNVLEKGIIDIQSNPKEIIRYNLKELGVEEVWIHTKNPIRFNSNYKKIKKLNYKFKVITYVTLYDKYFEPKVAPKNKIFDYIKKTAQNVGKENNAIGYGPLFKTSIYTKEMHLSRFEFLCKELKDNISEVYIDFNVGKYCLDSIIYKVEQFTVEEQTELFIGLKEIAEKYNLKLKHKLNPEELEDGIDIGETDACPFMCIHCPYITNKKTSLIKSMTNNPDSTLLFGKIPYECKIIDYKTGKIEVRK